MRSDDESLVKVLQQFWINLILNLQESRATHNSYLQLGQLKATTPLLV